MRSWPGQPTAEPAPDVLIVGGGVIGCSIAYYLALAGVRVLLLERDQIAAGASGVAAGMLAPQVEAAFDDPFFELTLLGRSEHAGLAATLLDEVGLDVEYRATGILRVARDEAERVELRRRQAWQTARGLIAEWLEPAELGAREPLLRGAAGRLLAGGLWLPDEGQVRSPRLVQALAAASVRRGARVIEGAWATSLTTSGAAVTAVESPVGRFVAGSYVLAAGVWSRDIAKTAGLELPVRPVKGQIVVLRAPRGSPAPRRLVG